MDIIDSTESDLALVYEALKKRIQTFDISWTRTKVTLHHLAHSFADEILTDTRFSRQQIRSLLERLLGVQSWPFLCEVEYEVAHGDHLHELALYEQWCDDLTVTQQAWVPRQDQCPRVFFRERIILHAHSGHRRPGGFQWYLEHLAVLPEHLELLVIALDLVIDETWGDIGNATTQAFWLDAIRSG